MTFADMLNEPLPEMTLGQKLWGIHANEDIIALVKEWASCHDVDLDTSSEMLGIWIANPQTGHWLDEDKKAEFVSWFSRNRR